MCVLYLVYIYHVYLCLFAGCPTFVRLNSSMSATVQLHPMLIIFLLAMSKQAGCFTAADLE